ncbi:hypothetical protein CCP3SC1_1330002 [Gammaproteobacteria bacterium]
MAVGNVFYETLPFLYSAGGVAVIIFSSEPVGRASGILLITAALFIFRLRLEYRKQRAANAEEKLYQAQIKLQKEKAASAKNN